MDLTVIKSLGFYILVGGLIGEVLVITFVHSGKREKILAAICAAIVLIGVVFEHEADIKLNEPRSINTVQQDAIVAKLKLFKGTHFDLSVITGDPEAMNFAAQIADTLRLSGWTWIEWNHPGGPFMFVYSWPGNPNVGQSGTIGVNVLIHTDHAPQFADAMNALSTALNAVDASVTMGISDRDDIPNHDTIHILVGKKVQ